MRHAVALASVLLSLSCAHAPPTKSDCTLPGAGSWRRYRSAHFIIDAAGWSRDPAHLVGAFEELHAAVLAALVPEPVEIPGHLHAIVLPSRLDVEEATGLRNIGGLFWISRLGEPSILLAAEDIDDIPQIIAHELTHYISFYLFPRQSYWFAEGLAQFVEGVAKPDRDGRRWAGADPASGWIAGSIELTRVEQLLNGKADGWSDHPYVTSWILYRFLWNERGDQLSRYQRLLSDGTAPSEAWRSSFPQWDPMTGTIGLLNNDLAAHQNSGRGLRWEVKLREVDRTFSVAASSAADVHMILLEHNPRATHRPVGDAVRREEAHEALRHEPGHPMATEELARLEGAPLLAALKAAVAARSRDGRAWYLLAREEKDPAEKEAALRRAIEYWPDGAFVHSLLAVHLAATGRAHEALPLANRAVDLAPWSPDAVASLAGVAVELGKCREAALLQARAIDAAEGHGLGSTGADTKALRQQLAAHQQRCKEASTGPQLPASSGSR